MIVKAVIEYAMQLVIQNALVKKFRLSGQYSILRQESGCFSTVFWLKVGCIFIGAYFLAFQFYIRKNV